MQGEHRLVQGRPPSGVLASDPDPASTPVVLIGKCTHVGCGSTWQFGRPTSPAMAAGLAVYPWSLAQLVELLGSK